MNQTKELPGAFAVLTPAALRVLSLNACRHRTGTWGCSDNLGVLESTGSAGDHENWRVKPRGQGQLLFSSSRKSAVAPVQSFYFQRRGKFGIYFFKAVSLDFKMLTQTKSKSHHRPHRTSLRASLVFMKS